MTNINRYQLLKKKTKDEYPRFNVKLRKESWLRFPFKVLSAITRKKYSTFTTTIFSTMYARDDWYTRSADKRYRTLRHEKKHIRQFHCWPLGRWAWPLNHLLMAIAYMLILPVRWTLRAKFEREGYTQTLLVDYELEGPFSEETMEVMARWLANTFGGSTYAWMWSKKKAYAWAMDTMRKINAGEIVNNDDRMDPIDTA